MTAHHGNHSYESEREILYKILYELRSNVSDMRHEINDIRKQINDAREIDSAAQRFAGSQLPALTTADEITPAPKYTYAAHQQQHVLEAEAEEIKETETLNLNDLGRQMVEKALEKNGGNRKKAAKELGISDRTLYRRIKQYGLDKNDK